MCSTPFGIKENRTKTRNSRGAVGRVLNAFRHQRESHSVRLPGEGIPVVCSTPFGIKENRTPPDTSKPAGSTGCSTPFGIKENRTRSLFCRGRRRDSVLNAFRHQRESHTPFPARILWDVSRAQRLSASKRIAQTARPPFRAKPKCAQRLSASKRIALIDIEQDFKSLECSTPFGIKENRTCRLSRQASASCVLNAFRHQRESHAPLFALEVPAYRVLNAFRHQRESHHVLGQVLAHAIQCSTPFGIKENRTDATGAAATDAEHVLNAFRHQRESHANSNIVHQSMTDGAQRLSASKRIAQWFTVTAVRSWYAVLNAFRHQRESHCRSLLCSSAPISCSTPFGIKENRTGTRISGSATPMSAQRLSASKRIAH